jgi:hypothetical protein
MELEPERTQRLSFDDNWEDPSVPWPYDTNSITPPSFTIGVEDDDWRSWETEHSSRFIDPSFFKGRTSWDDIRDFEWGFVWARQHILRARSGLVEAITQPSLLSELNKKIDGSLDLENPHFLPLDSLEVALQLSDSGQDEEDHSSSLEEMADLELEGLAIETDLPLPDSGPESGPEEIIADMSTTNLAQIQFPPWQQVYDLPDPAKPMHPGISVQAAGMRRLNTSAIIAAEELLQSQSVAGPQSGPKVGLTLSYSVSYKNIMSNGANSHHFFSK